MPVRNDADRVADTLDSLFAQSRLPDEVVVADGCSTDDTVERIKAYSGRGVPIHVVPNQSLFCGGGRNAATRAASNDVLITLDLGNRADPGWLEAMAREFEQDPELDYLGGVFYPILDTSYGRVSGAIIYFDDCVGMSWSREELERNKPQNALPGGLCMAYRRSIWERAGEFSEWARKGQDRLFSHRIQRINGKIDMSLDAVMHHHMGHSLRDDFNRHYLYGLWIARTALPRARFWRLFTTYALGVLLLAASFFLPWLLMLAPVLVLIYVYVGAWRKLDILAKLTGEPFSMKERLCAIAVLFVKDAAVLSGNIIGSIDRLVRPRWRRMSRQYLEEGR
jgi:glycosyltransferase involved in cell wall biosynthesis